MRFIALLGVLVAAQDISEQEFAGTALGTGAIFGLQGSRLLRIDTLANYIQVELPGDDQLCGWPQLLEANGDLWAVPCAAHHVLRISPIGVSKLSLGPSDVSCQWRHAAVAPNGAIYAMPWEASAVLRVATDVRLLGHLGVTNQGKFGFTVASQEYVCGIPWAARRVLCLHTSKDELLQFGDFSDLAGKWRTAAARHGIIFALPVEADSVLEIDPAARRARELEHFPTGQFTPILLSRWSGGLALGDDSLVALPGFDCSILKVDMSLAKIGRHQLDCGGGAVHNWHSAVVAKNGAIYAVPFSASFALKLEFQGDSLQATRLGSFGNNMGKWSQAILSQEGDVYGVPWSAEKVLKIRPLTDQVSSFGNFEPGPARWKEGVLASTGLIYCIPEAAPTILRIDPSSDTTLQLPVTPGGLAPPTPVTTFSGTTTTVQVMCLGFICPGGAKLRPDASELVCRHMPCFEICCLSSCESFQCLEGYSKKPRAQEFSCQAGYCSSTDLLTCCNVDLWYPNVLVPLLIFAFTGLTCVWAQSQRCRKERLSRRRKFSVLYFTVLFAWDVCDQTASWWFWQYTGDVGASLVVQGLAMMSAMMGTVIILLAFFAGLFMTTSQLLDQHAPELAYSVAAGCADVIMLICVFIFETEGLDEGSWIKILNLIATLIDFILKVLQAAGALFGTAREDEDPLLDTVQE